ncbi:hypothetical protein MGL_4157 [Malassezia globosa CBS 7966]|uniref:Cytochrome P450 n=1 Tax=Malassezia globosa (strain ATCC MYA-4612 / CBS 7966) TaxID=425265 RepID=A8QD83_MALGO|nr:uncharacterized protein MGL_4151 [Malassezia globosa CBS 7966]XP_001728678.1 uncharacterized protein MGL_4157 [Malassezia globosa CBS 7966]EDP41458.1 hypothetical protein MGL_4151 [Malassezia globosa CBS 7966]EDP41464.1 hypothetical protein MGL_4157 [Malassezia globosa CBS 7966]
MLLNPAIQEKAHAEIDTVVGPNRLPGYEDEVHLPLVRAIIKETLRWRPPTVMGVPHAVTVDDEYYGYKIPKGSTVIGNSTCSPKILDVLIWPVFAMSHDPKRYPNPELFDPEARFYKSHPGSAAEYATKRNSLERDHFAYGHGRRICAGSE